MYFVTPWQRACLILLPLCMFLWWQPLHFMHNVYFVYTLLALETFCVVINFPQLITFFHSKPLYICDLEDQYTLTVSERRRFQLLFVRLQQLVTILCIPIVLQYYLHKYPHITRQNWLENLAIAYSALNLMTTTTSKIGSFVLTVVFHVKKNHHEFMFPDTV